MKRFLGFYILGIVLPFGLMAAPVQEGNWKAGIAKVVITPSEPMWMAGYAARVKPAEGKQHDLWAKAIVLEDRDGKQSVMVATDLLGYTRQLSLAIKQRLRDQYGLSGANIVLNGSHTHSGPVLSGALVDIYPYGPTEQARIDRYTHWLEERIIGLVAQAFKDLKPVRLYSGIGISRFQVNRRNNDSGELYRLTDYNGPSDYAVPVMKVTDMKGKVEALLFSYACHPTTLDGYEWSGDYPGYAQLELEKEYEGAIALFFQGASADQNPLPRRSVALAMQYGKELSAAVVRVLQEDNMKELQPVLKTAYHEVHLPLSPAPSKDGLKAVIEKDGNRTYFSRWAQRLIDRLDRGEKLEAFYPYPVQAWKLGDQLLFNLGGEVVVEYGINLKEKYGWDSFVFAYSNDVMGYIPTVTILNEGGYEGDSSQKVYGLPSLWDPRIESLIYSACDQVAADLK